jgi:indolepyruvate ferredoxin oxidoreductase
VQAQFAAAKVIEFVKRPSLAQAVQRRVDFLTGYQDAAYAHRYLAVVERVKAAEAPLGSTRLTDAVARNLFKLMAYKDEYEVARLHTDPAFLAKLADQFEDGYKLKYHLAPPLLAAKNARGELVKKTYGGWMKAAFGVLAKFKGLRGTAFDVFGHTEERKMERALIVEYRALVDELLAALTKERLADAVALASLPEEIRGYGHVKERHLAKARAKRDTLLAAWRAGRTETRAA